MNYELYAESYRKIRPDASENEIKQGYSQYGIGVEDAFGQGIMHGSYSLLGSLGGFGSMLGLPTEEWGREMQAEAQNYAMPESLRGSIVDDPGLLLNPAWWGYSLGDIAPSVASSFIPGGVFAGAGKLAGASPKMLRALAGAGGFLGGGAQEAGGEYLDTGELGKSWAYFLASGALNAPTTSRILGRAMGGPGGNVVSNLLKDATIEAATEWAEEPVAAAIYGRDILEAMKQGVNVLPASFVSGGLMSGAGAVANKENRQAIAKKFSDASKALPESHQQAMLVAEPSQDVDRAIEMQQPPAATPAKPDIAIEQKILDRAAELEREIYMKINKDGAGKALAQISMQMEDFDFITPQVLGMDNAEAAKTAAIMIAQKEARGELPEHARADREGITLDQREDIGISRKDLEDIAQRLWGLYGDSYREDGFSSPKELLMNRDTYTLGLEIDSDYNIHQLYLQNMPDDFDIEEAINAYRKGEELGKGTAAKKTEPLGLPKEIDAEPTGKPWAPKPVTITPTEAWTTANQKLPRMEGDAKQGIINARKDVLLAWNQGKLDLPAAEVNKKLRSWAAYPAKGKAVHQSINTGVPEQLQWMGIPNASYINKATIDHTDVDQYVNSIKVNDEAWYGRAGETLRTYIMRTFLNIDTRIDYSDLNFIIDTTLKPLGRYSPGAKTVTIRAQSPHTVAHEIGHYLDHKWASEAYPGATLGASDMRLAEGVVTQYTSDMRERWMNRFHEFVTDISKRADLRSEYTQDRMEVFARFVDGFARWTDEQAGVRTWGEKHYTDRFTTSDFRAFAKLLQEKAMVDIHDGNPHGSAAQAGEAKAQEVPRGTPAITPERTAEVGGQQAGFEAKRGVMSWAETERIAEMMGTTPQKVQELMARKKGKAHNVEEMESAAIAVREVFEGTHEMAQVLAEKAKLGTLTPEELQEAYEIFVRSATVGAQMTGAAGEAGRALNILKKSQDAIQQAKELQNLIDDQGGLEAFQTKLIAFADAKNPLEAAERAKESFKITAMDMLAEWYKAMLLTGPSTHIVNIVGNETRNWLQGIDHMMAAVVGSMHGGEKATYSEALAFIGSHIRGMRYGAHKAAEAWKSGEDVLGSKVSEQYKEAIPGKFGKVVRIPFKLLGSMDSLAKGAGYFQALHRLTANTGVSSETIDMWLKTDTVPENLKKEAWKEAEKMTYTEEGGEIAEALSRMRNRVPALNFILPFIRTPANIVRDALQHSPVAPIFRDVRQDIAKGGKARDLAVGKIITGTAFGGAIWMLAAMGKITGSPPDDRNERKMWQIKGIQPFSIKLGDSWYSYSRLDPLGIIFGLAADAWTLKTQIGTKDMDDLAALVMGSIANNLTNKTYLSGLSDLFLAMSDPARYMDYALRRMGASFIVPTGIAYIARANDPYLRRAESLMDSIKARLPGLSQTLEPVLDVRGEPRMREGGPLYTMVSPIWKRTETPSRTADELVRLDVSFPSASKKFRGVELTPKEHNELIRALGRPTWNIVKRIVSSEGYRGLPDPLKKYILEKVIAKSRRGARLYWSQEHPKIMQEVMDLKRQRYAVQ